MTMTAIDGKDLSRYQTIEQQYGHVLGFIFLCLEKFGEKDEDGNLEIIFPPEQVPADRDMPEGTLVWGYLPEEFQGAGASLKVAWQKGEAKEGE